MSPTFPQLMYSTAVSLKKKYTKSPWLMELTKSGAETKEEAMNTKAEKEAATKDFFAHH